ncbi:MAG TPA: hypothetical protein VFU02_05290 [Polyangiaceae bacterium]|nr:hypothetical protein [Polyangiaceae bacterium]
MTHRHDWSKAVSWQGDDPPNGFERTLPPGDPRARSGAPASGYAVRDNRRQVVMVREQAAAVEAQTPPAPTFRDIPVSGVRKLGSTDQLRAGIPVARITRDLDDAPFEMDTWFDPRRQVDPVMELTPDFASEYVPPQPVPEVAQHKTFELRPVRLDPAIHPRTAPTVLNARAIKRRHDKQQKDAHEIALLLEQSHRRRRGPWIAFAFVVVVAIGFAIGVELVDSTAAGAEVGTNPSRAVGAVPVAPAPAQKGAAVPSDTGKQVPPALAAPTARNDAQPASAPKRESSEQTTLRSSNPRPPRVTHEAQTPQAQAAGREREVWLE